MRRQFQSSKIRLLILEDSQPDVELMVQELRKAGFDPQWAWVANEKEYLSAIQKDYDVILSDFLMPQFDALRALCILKERGIDIPFIVVSGKIDEEAALSCFKEGADDYVLKDRLGRLGSAVELALERKHLMEEKQKAERFGRILEDSLNEIYIFDAETLHFIQVNKGARKNLGYTLEELQALTPLDLKPEFTPEAFSKLVEPLLAREKDQIIFSTAHKRKDGSLYPVEVHLQLSTTHSPHVFVAIILNITERKRVEENFKQLEAQLNQAQKLEAIGQLAAGIAHEINTPTQYVGDNTNFLNDSFGDLLTVLEKYRALEATARAGNPDPALLEEIRNTQEEVDLNFLMEEIPKAIKESLNGVKRVAEIVQAMKKFSHPGSTEKTAVNINDAIQNTILVTRNEWKYVSEMKTDFDEALPLVPCLPGEFNQVILNMIINARDAISGKVGDGAGGKGIIRISTHQRDACAEIRIEDTGAGRALPFHTV